MSMILGLNRLATAKLQALTAKSWSENDVDALLEELEEEAAGENATGVDLDKAWHGIHYLLTQTAWEGEEPLCYLLAGGTELPDLDMGYGPARVLSAEQTAAFAQALASLEESTLAERFEPDALAQADIYPDIWHEEDDEALEYLLEYFRQLREFVTTAARHGDGLLVSMS